MRRIVRDARCGAKSNGGIVVLSGTCRNQNGMIVLEANAKMLIGNT